MKIHTTPGRGAPPNVLSEIEVARRYNRAIRFYILIVAIVFGVLVAVVAKQPWALPNLLVLALTGLPVVALQVAKTRAIRGLQHEPPFQQGKADNRAPPAISATCNSRLNACISRLATGSGGKTK